MSRLGSGGFVLLIAGIFGASALLARVATQPIGLGDERDRRQAPSVSAYDSATVRVEGVLSEPVRRALPATVGRDLLLVVLDSIDVRQCEDLGRQLRELQAASGRSLIVVADDGSLANVAAFAQRERLRSEMLGMSPSSTIEGFPELPTPAVLVSRDGGRTVSGVAHPRRFANVRVRSFTEELDSLLRATPSSWRDGPVSQPASMEHLR